MRRIVQDSASKSRNGAQHSSTDIHEVDKITQKLEAKIGELFGSLPSTEEDS